MLSVNIKSTDSENVSLMFSLAFLLPAKIIGSLKSIPNRGLGLAVLIISANSTT